MAHTSETRQSLQGPLVPMAAVQGHLDDLVDWQIPAASTE